MGKYAKIEGFKKQDYRIKVTEPVAVLDQF